MQRYDLFFNSQNIWRIYSSLVYSIYYILKMDKTYLCMQAI